MAEETLRGSYAITYVMYVCICGLRIIYSHNVKYNTSFDEPPIAVPV